MCYCKTQGQSLDDAISNGKSQVEELTSKVSSWGASMTQLQQEVAGHTADRQKAEQTVKESRAVREKEETEFSEVSGEMKSNIESITSALQSLKTGGTAMLQNPGFGNELRDVLSRNAAVSTEERTAVLGFLSTGEGEDADGSLDQIIGVLSQMLDETKKALEDATASEAERKTNYEELVDAKGKEIKATTLSIESKMDRAAQAAQKRVAAKHGLDSTDKALITSEEMKVTLLKNCEDKHQEYLLTSKARAEEMSALSEAVQVLNSDEALDLFKKAAPAASFLQTSSHSTLRALLRSRSSLGVRGHSRLRLAQRRVRARVVSSKGFEKVVGMVDGMVNILKESENSDAAKREHCLLSMKDTEAKFRELKEHLDDIGGRIEEKRNEADEISSEIASTKAGIAALDKSVAEATEQRKSEHAAFVASAAASNTATDLLNMAVNRLNKVYNPSSYSTTAEPDLLQTGDEPSGIFFTQVSARKQNSAGIFALFADIQKAVALKMSEEKHEEEEAQKEYEATMGEAAKKRADDAQVIVISEVTKSEIDAQVQDLKAQNSQKSTMLKFTKEKISYLHRFCDDFLETYEERQKARVAEIESDKTGQQILGSADTNATAIVEPSLAK
jgi:peptidoglycan hydrolase CwlO-like protein